MATMKEVADRAGVSVATVSRVINKTGYVTPELQARVLAVMDSLKYQPSALARSLRRQETRTIGVIIPQLDHPVFGALAFSIEKALFAQEYHSLICSSEDNPDKENTYIEMMLRQRVDGVILVPTARSLKGILQLIEKAVPLVLAVRDLPDVLASRVLVRNYEGGYSGTRHLLEMGHRKIGVIGTQGHSTAMRQRMDGVYAALRDYRIRANPDWIVLGPLPHMETGYRAAAHMLEPRDRPTAIFALSDTIAIGVMHAAAERSLGVPARLSVIGFDDLPVAQYSIPALTTVAQPIGDLGEAATRLMLEHVRDSGREIDTVWLDTSIRVRASVSAPCEESDLEPVPNRRVYQSQSALHQGNVPGGTNGTRHEH